jgi:hypothetical protein
MWDLDLKRFHDQGTYFLHDNGERPFLVHVEEDPARVLVYRNIDCEPLAGELWFVFDALRVFVPEGFDWSSSDTGPLGCPWYGGKGNTILALLDDDVEGLFKYVYIGGTHTYIFYTEEEIWDFQSPIGNNDVPYPWASTPSHAYLLCEGVRIEGVPDDPYTHYYAWDRFLDLPQEEQGSARRVWRESISERFQARLLARGRVSGSSKDPTANLSAMYTQFFNVS